MSNPVNSTWTQERDEYLMEMVAEGCSFRGIARELGVSHNVVMDRFKRLARELGPQAV